MITQQQLTSVLGQLPEQFSIGELVDKLVSLSNTPDIFSHPTASIARMQEESGNAPIIAPVASPPLTEEAERAYYTSPEAQAIYGRFPSSPRVRALRGIAAGLPPEDIRKTAKEWEAERIEKKYGL